MDLLFLASKLARVGKGDGYKSPLPNCENLVEIATFAPHRRHNKLIQIKLSL